jgi:TPP-dependent trihydroxycyclohexane-1,2-dione (THcHDO) dehydratase
MLKENYGTLSETINALKMLGYSIDFNIGNACLVCNQTLTEFSPDEFVIDKLYRFEGDSNPDDQSILYAISSLKHAAKGVLINGYGISSDEAVNDLVAKLKTHPD